MRRLGHLAVLVGLLALAGCSGSSGTSSSGGGMSGMSGMSGSGGSSTPGMPMKAVAHADWEGMKITIAESPPETFTVFSGTQETEVTPTSGDSIHLMVVLADDQTGDPIPYATVWASITDSSGRTVFDARLWPMISRTMGTHYGINVPLPAKGIYDISVQVGPPQGGRLPEYTDVWTQPHTVTAKFEWTGKA
jgi:hypothetical protein